MWENASVDVGMIVEAEFSEIPTVCGVVVLAVESNVTVKLSIIDV